jgi:pseudouridine-5'-phosphate glycosidase
METGGGGSVLAQPVAEDVELDPEEVEAAIGRAEADAVTRGVRGAALTPFLLSRLAELTGGRSLRANQALILANARFAGEVALCLAVTSSEAPSTARRTSRPGPG